MLEMFERLEAVAQESWGVCHNARTGHSALCEPNYTPMDENGGTEVGRALAINEQFQVTRQFPRLDGAAGRAARAGRLH